MEQNEKVCCLIDPRPLDNIFFFTVTVPAKKIESFFNIVSMRQQSMVNPLGFKKGAAPLTYIQEHFKSPIFSHLKDLGLKFFGINTLLQQIRNQKIVIVGTPELKDISIDKHGNALYSFQGHSAKELYMQSWKYLPFQPTPRKKYRDIDKQVTSFLQKEEENSKLYNPNQGIQVDDWVFFKTWILDGKHKPIFTEHPATTWIRVGDEEPDFDFQQILLGKKINDTFITEIPSLQTYFCENSHSNYTYLIQICDIVPYQALSFDIFKNYFKIKTYKDLLSKITEVFSFNNDISQRRLIAHEALEIIIKKNQIVLPDFVIEKQKKQIIADLQFKSDFMVYKMDSQFESNIHNMAQRQLLDGVVAEHIGFHDNVTVQHNDLKAILQCTQRPRLKDFLYFPFIKSQFQGQEFPIENEHLHNFCLKEKAINHIIYHLTKK